MQDTMIECSNKHAVYCTAVVF